MAYARPVFEADDGSLNPNPPDPRSLPWSDPNSDPLGALREAMSRAYSLPSSLLAPMHNIVIDEARAAQVRSELSEKINDDLAKSTIFTEWSVPVFNASEYVGKWDFT